jgi:hypothetical protein
MGDGFMNDPRGWHRAPSATTPFVSEAAAISLNYGPRPACSLLVRRAEPIH